MSGDTEVDDPDVSDGASENEYSDHEQEVGREEDDNTYMAEQNFRPGDDENGKEGGSTVTAKPKLDPKDPLRPRRKKARRACFACQRAHLTCGMFVYICPILSKNMCPCLLELYLCSTSPTRYVVPVNNG
jgi:hypothetical protein